MNVSQSLLEHSATEAKGKFLTTGFYFKADLPSNFEFESLLAAVDGEIGSNPLSGFGTSIPPPVRKA